MYKTYRSPMQLHINIYFFRVKNNEVLPRFHTGGFTSSTCNLVFFQRAGHDEYQGKLIEPNLMPFVMDCYIYLDLVDFLW